MRAKEFLNEAPLGQGVFKYETNPRKDRVPTFLEKIITQSPFTVKTASGEEEVVFDPDQYDEIAQHLEQKSTKFKLRTMEDPPRLIPFGSIKKTKDFGGEETGSREKEERDQIADFSKELEKVKAGQSSITLIVGNTKVRAARFSKTPELIGGKNPKSDMTVYNENNEPVAWVSLKASNARKWGGFQHLIGTSTDIKSWIDKIKEITGGELSPGQSFGHHLTDDTVKNKIVFGKDFGKPKFGISNVNVVLMGKVSIDPLGNGVFKLNADNVYPNGITPTGIYEPYLAVRYANGRPDIGLKNARAETNTKNEKRKVQWLDDLSLPVQQLPQPEQEPVQQEPAPIPAGIQNQDRTLANKIPMGQDPATAASTGPQI